MFRVSNPNQGQLIDPFYFVGPKRRQMLENGWPGLFREYLYGELPVDEIKPKFHTTMGRPTKELHTALGCLMLQQMFDLTDQEVVRQLAFNIEWHYAFNIFDEEDDSKYMCERTLREYRSAATQLGFDEIMFRSTTDKLLDVFKIHTGKQRLDSTHICSDMRQLSRLGVFAKTIKKFLKVMERYHPTILKRDADEDLVARYLDKEKKGCFSRVKPSEAKKRLQEVAEDLLVLVERFRDHRTIRKMDEYGLLVRVLEEQCEVEEETEEPRVIVKDPKEVPSTSLQNPSDPDATYDGHKGQGYQLQIMEIFQEEEEENESQPNFITHVNVQQAHESDGDAVSPAVEETKERGCAPRELVADTAYGSDDNVQKAAKEGTDLIAPTSGKPRKKGECLILDDFVIDEASGKVTACPVGEIPVEIKEGRNGKLRIFFDGEKCKACEHRDHCCVGQDEKKHVLEYTPKQRRLAQRRLAEESEAFREKYRWRSGIEATNSHLKRDLRIGRLRVRGLANVRYVATLKVLGWNILQAVRARKARISARFGSVSAGMAWIVRLVRTRLHDVGTLYTLRTPIRPLKPIRR